MGSTKVAIIGRGGEWSGLPVIRELGKLGHKCFTLFQHTRSTASYSRYCTKDIRIPGEINGRLITDIIHICRANRISHLICLDEEIKKMLIDDMDRLDEFCVALPTPEDYGVALRKNRATRLAKSLGIPVPGTYNIERKEDLGNLDFNDNKMYVVKGIRGVSSLHVRYARDHVGLMESYDDIKRIERTDMNADTAPMVQEYVGGPTYLTMGLAQNGRVKIVVPEVKLREWPVTGGVTTRGKTINEPRLREYTKRFMEALNWHGEAGMEWKFDQERDDFYFLEMNPRFEGCIDLAVKSGVNMPGLLLKVINGEEIEEGLQYSENIHYRWFFRLDCQHFFRYPYRLSTFLVETVDPRVHGEITIDDPMVIRSFWKTPLLALKRHLGS